MGLFEILMIAAITLFVVGPERMPEAVRSVALTVGRIKRSFHSAKQEIEKQIGVDDIRRQLHNEEVMQNLKATRDEMEAMLQLEHDQASRVEEYNHSLAEDGDESHQHEGEDNRIVHPDQMSHQVEQPGESTGKNRTNSSGPLDKHDD